MSRGLRWKLIYDSLETTRHTDLKTITFFDRYSFEINESNILRKLDFRSALLITNQI